MKNTGSSLAVLIIALTVALLASSCSSTQSSHGAYPTLKQTQMNVDWPMTRYRNAVAAGAVTTGEQEQINTAYAQYHSAFETALQAAGHNYEAATPESVKRLANELISDLGALPI